MDVDEGGKGVACDVSKKSESILGRLKFFLSSFLILLFSVPRAITLLIRENVECITQGEFLCVVSSSSS